MNDYWNDPPEVEEGPSCIDKECGGECDYVTDSEDKHRMLFRCTECLCEFWVPVPRDPDPGALLTGLPEEEM